MANQNDGDTLRRWWPIITIILTLLVYGVQAEIRLRVLEDSYAKHVETVDGDLAGIKTLMLRICDKVVGGPTCRIER